MSVKSKRQFILQPTKQKGKSNQIISEPLRSEFANSLIKRREKKRDEVLKKKTMKQKIQR